MFTNGCSLCNIIRIFYLMAHIELDLFCIKIQSACTFTVLIYSNYTNMYV